MNGNDENLAFEGHDVVFLGAGASKADGAPLQFELFNHFFQLNENRENVIIRNALSNFFQDFFGIDIDGDTQDSDFPTFEEVLGILEIALKRGESFRSLTESQIRKIRENLIFSMAISIKSALERPSTHHYRLVERLCNSGLLRNTCFISFNYDILIDNALMNAGTLIDYGTDFTNPESIIQAVENIRNMREPVASTQLYKLHGSLNWLYCPSCNSLTLTPNKKSVIELAYSIRNCDSCGTPVAPIIIPPTFFKVMQNCHLQQIWHKAEIALRNARRLYFCGYSFPDADIHVRYLLKRAEVNSGRTPRVVIINNHSEKSDSSKGEEEKRYKRFFKDKDNVTYKDISFQEFAHRGIE